MSSAPPLVSGRQQLTRHWFLVLPFPMARRIDGDSLVFWHSPRKLTFWLSSFGNEASHDARSAIDLVRQTRSRAAFDENEEEAGGLLFHSYRLLEDNTQEPSFYGNVANAEGQRLLIAGYFDFPDLLGDVQATWRSVGWEG